MEKYEKEQNKHFSKQDCAQLGIHLFLHPPLQFGNVRRRPLPDQPRLHRR